MLLTARTTNRPNDTSLLAHVNLELRSNLVAAKELASDVMAWDKTFEDGRFISIKHVIALLRDSKHARKLTDRQTRQTV
jgi:hypothetical protein